MHVCDTALQVLQRPVLQVIACHEASAPCQT